MISRKFGLSKHIGLTLGLLLCSLSIAHANRDSIIQVHRRVADSLNAVILRGEPIVNTGFPIRINVLDCDTTSTLPITITYTGTTFTITVQKKGITTVDLAGVHHPLVDNLNAYLDHSWALRVDRMPNGQTLIPYCDHMSDPVRYYRYFDDELDYSFVNQGQLHNYIDIESGRNALLQSSYIISGTSYVGSSFIETRFNAYNAYKRGYFVDIDSQMVKVIPPDIYITDPTDVSVEWRIRPAIPYYYLAETPLCPQTLTGPLGGYQGSGSLVEWFSTIVTKTGGVDESCYLTGSIPIADFYDNYNQYHRFTELFFYFGIDADGDLVLDYVPDAPCGGIPVYYPYKIFHLIDPESPEEYCVETFCLGGTFDVDELTGNLVYIAPATDGCGSEFNPQPVYCFGFCDTLSPCVQYCLEGVLAANATTFSDYWPYDTTKWGVGPVSAAAENDFERGIRGRWRVETNNAYNTAITPGSKIVGATDRIYKNAGVFSTPLELFNWSCRELNDTAKWIRLDTMTAYSPHGEPIEQLDALYIPSGALFAHRASVPKMVATNTHETAIDFESFEDEQRHEYDPERLRVGGHSGRYSLLVSNDDDPDPDRISPTLATVTVDQQMIDHGVLVKFWIKTTYNEPNTSILTDSGYINPVQMVLNGTPQGGDHPRRIAQTGEWTLFEYTISTLTSGDLGDKLEIALKNITVMDAVWVDDIRTQPREAQATCYVYDEGTLRLITSFDDQHFGLYYQYNGEGKLVRKLRETERGLRTLEEAQYHTPLVDRTDEPGEGLAYRDPNDNQSGTSLRRGRRMKEPAWAVPQNSFEVVKLDLTPDGERISLFGSRPMRLEELKTLETPSITSLPLPDVEKWQALAKLGELTSKVDSLQMEVEGMTPSQREMREAALREAVQARGELMRKLGINEEQVRQILRDVQRVERDVRQSTTPSPRTESPDKEGKPDSE